MENYKKIPEKGYYYHHKHDPTGPLNNYAYEVIGIGLHTEGSHTELSPKDQFVVYRPIYEAYVYKMGKIYDIRPLELFMENVKKIDKSGKEKTFPRFQKITDENIISELKKKVAEMYGE